MPFAPVSNPDLAGQFIYQGISQAGAAIGGGINQAITALAEQREKDKQLNQVAKASEAMFKASPELQKRLGLTPEQFAALDAHTKIGTVSGAVASIHNDVVAEQLQQSQEQVAALKQEREARAKFNKEFTDRMTPQVGPTPTGETLGTAPLKPGEVEAMGARAGLSFKDLVDASKAFERYGVPGTVTKLPTNPGQPDIYGVWETPSTFVPLPIGQTQPRQAPKTTPVEGGVMFTDETGKSTFHRTSSPDDLGVLGKSDVDATRRDIAELDVEISKVQQRISKEGPQTLVSVDAKGNIDTPNIIFGRSANITLKGHLDNLIARKAAAVTKLESFRSTRKSSGESDAATKAPPSGGGVSYDDFEKWRKGQ